MLREKYKWCFSFVKKEIAFVFISLIFSLVVSYIDTLEPKLTGSLMDYLGTRDFRSFLYLLLFLFLIQATAMVINIGQDRFSYFLKKRITINGEKVFFSKLIKRKNSQFLEGKEARILNTIQSDLPYVLSIWTSLIPNIVISTFTLVMVSIRLVNLDVSVFLLSLLVSVVPLFIYRIAGKKELILNKEGKEKGDNYLTCIQDSIAEIHENTGRSATFFLERFINRVKDNYKVVYKRLNLSQSIRVILFVFNVLSVSAIYFLLGYGIYVGKNSVGDFMAAILYSQHLRSLIKSYGGLFQGLIAQSISIDRVRELIEREDTEYIELKREDDLGIDISNLSFEYQEGHPVIAHYSLSITHPGLYVIKGRNGIGKTTLLKVIAGMIDKSNIKDGSVVISGCNDLSDIAYLPSQPVFIKASIRDNLLLGYKVDDDTLLSLIEKIGLTSWLNNQEKGLDTILDSEKTGLSKGQTMRFALISNLARNRKIYLIDEIEDGVDAESRAEVFSLLTTLSREKIVLVVSHTTLFDDRAEKIELL